MVEACDANLALRVWLALLEDITEHNPQCNPLWSRQRDLRALLGPM